MKEDYFDEKLATYLCMYKHIPPGTFIMGLAAVSTKPEEDMLFFLDEFCMVHQFVKDQFIRTTAIESPDHVVNYSIEEVKADLLSNEIFWTVWANNI